MGYLSQVYLHNFRNYFDQRIELKPGLTVLSGANGQGKTSFLEAVYFLSLLRSFRTRKTPQLCNWQHKDFWLAASLHDEEEFQDTQLSVVYGSKRTLSINSETVAKSSDFIRQFNAVCFVPEDIEIIKGPSSERRQFIDVLLSQLYPSYLFILQSYNKALKSRNAILRQCAKEQRQDLTLINSFSEALIKYGKMVHEFRQRLLTLLQPIVNDFTKKMFPGHSDFTMSAQSNYPADAKDFEESYRQTLQQDLLKDIKRCQTTAGPHRDEIQMLLNGKVLSDFGSEGQCRLASLILKTSAAELLIQQSAEHQNQSVILLIDDVIGELDEKRKEAFFATILRGDQVFLACTETPEAIKKITHNSIKVEGGVLIP